MNRYRLLSIVGLIIWLFSLVYASTFSEFLVSVFANITGSFMAVLGIGIEMDRRKNEQV